MYCAITITVLLDKDRRHLTEVSRKSAIYIIAHTCLGISFPAQRESYRKKCSLEICISRLADERPALEKLKFFCIFVCNDMYPLRFSTCLWAWIQKIIKVINIIKWLSQLKISSAQRTGVKTYLPVIWARFTIGFLKQYVFISIYVTYLEI